MTHARNLFSAHAHRGHNAPNRTACRARNRASTPSLTLARLDDALRAQGHAPGASFHGGAPAIAAVPSPNGDVVAGRYFPSRNAILVYEHSDPLVTLATVNHERVHAGRYEAVCQGTSAGARRGCAYKGDHDAGFYRDLEALHRATGVPPAAARVPEGRYPMPAHWRRDDAW